MSFSKKNNLVNEGTPKDLRSLLIDLLGMDRYVDNNWFENRWMKNGPAANVREYEDHYLIELAVPGMSKEHFDISIEHGAITISAEKSRESQEEREHFTHMEFSHHSFARSFTLPEFIDCGHIEAKYDKGLLQIVLPKLKEKENKPKQKVEVE